LRQDCVCIPFRGWMGKAKYWSAIEQGSRCQAVWFVSRTATVFHAQQFPVCINNGPPPKGHPANLTQLCEALESTWPSIPLERFRHLVESMPWRIVAVLRAKGGATRYQEGVPNFWYTQCILYRTLKVSLFLGHQINVYWSRAQDTECKGYSEIFTCQLCSTVQHTKQYSQISNKKVVQKVEML
jgi:hypothetical protein